MPKNNLSNIFYFYFTSFFLLYRYLKEGRTNGYGAYGALRSVYGLVWGKESIETRIRNCILYFDLLSRVRWIKCKFIKYLKLFEYTFGENDWLSILYIYNKDLGKCLLFFFFVGETGMGHFKPFLLYASLVELFKEDSKFLYFFFLPNFL